MEQKYSVPALDRAHSVLSILADEPGRWKMSDLCKRLDISKSTMFSLLTTMERLQWVVRDSRDTFSIGSAVGRFGSAYFRQYDLADEFRRNAEPVMRRVLESVQLARLEKSDVLYLAKVEAPTPVQMVSGPGVRFPAHATGLGKALLSGHGEQQLRQLYPQDALEKITVHTIGSREALIQELKQVRKAGYATDIQEGVMGFCCVAAPIRRINGEIVAAVSCSMPIHHWEGKREDAIREMHALAVQLSANIH